MSARPVDDIELTLPETAAGERLDKVLASMLPDFSRATLQRWAAEGRVLLEGRPASRAHRVRGGEHVLVRPAPPPPSRAEPQDIPLHVVYEDEHLLVVDKPAGMVVHPGAGHPDGTLVNALLHHGIGQPGGDPLRPGIVHRIDKDTSGLLVVARSEAAREGLVDRFRRHDIERSYLAIATGHPPERATWRTLHGRHPRDRKRFSSRVTRGREAVTHVEVRERLHGAALLVCRLETGRTHQIRVHLADHGFPLLGDPLYGRPSRDPRLRAAAGALGRQALHAAVLGFEHPVTGERLRFESPVPDDLRAALSDLRLETP